MLTRRGLLSATAILTTYFVTAPAPVLSQGKKAGSGDGMTRLIGIDGSYRAAGLNADGSSYSGTVEITQQGDAVEFTWHVGDDIFRGAGPIEGRVVTIDWGDTYPVIYVVMDDGELHGTWADGTAMEKLTPR